MLVWILQRDIIWTVKVFHNFFAALSLVFSVLRLCGSRQVVAQCRADERIIQVQILCPSLGSQKWSADLYAVRSLVRQLTTGKHKNNQKTKTEKQKPQNPAKRALTKTAPMGQATYVPMNSEILHRNNRNTPDHKARSCEGVDKPSTSSAETQDPPCQDPGDRAEEPSGHETSSQ